MALVSILNISVECRWAVKDNRMSSGFALRWCLTSGVGWDGGGSEDSCRKDGTEGLRAPVLTPRI